MTLSSPLMEAKAGLRRDMRAKRLALSQLDRDDAAMLAAQRLLALPWLKCAQHVALYSAMHGELSPAPLAVALLDMGATVYYPRFEKSDLQLSFHAVHPAELAPGPLGIPRPAQTSPAVSPDLLDLAIVPGLAFDARGGRLGWGGGYYDHTLARHPRIVRVGFAHDFQLVDQVPTGPADVFMDFVATASAVRPTGAEPAPLLRRQH